MHDSDTAIVINTHAGRALFKATLSAVLECRMSSGPTLVYDDALTPQSIDGVLYGYSCLNDPGKARLEALKFALKTGCRYILALDDDLELKRGFDSDAITLWVGHHDEHPGCVASPYRTELASHLDREMYFDGHVWGNSIPGCAIMFTRSVLSGVLQHMPDYCWSHCWDWCLGGFVNGVIRPYKSKVRHVGGLDGLRHTSVIDGLGF